MTLVLPNMLFSCSLALTFWAEWVTWPPLTSNGWVTSWQPPLTLRHSCNFHPVVPVVSLQQTVKTFLVLAQRFRLPVFLADTAALKLLSRDAVWQRDRLVLEPHCSFLCTGRPVVSFALFANAWKSDVSVTSTVENYRTDHIIISHLLSFFMLFVFNCKT